MLCAFSGSFVCALKMVKADFWYPLEAIESSLWQTCACGGAQQCQMTPISNNLLLFLAHHGKSDGLLVSSPLVSPLYKPWALTDRRLSVNPVWRWVGILKTSKVDFGFYSCKCQHSGALPFMKFLSFKSLDYVWMFCTLVMATPIRFCELVFLGSSFKWKVQSCSVITHMYFTKSNKDCILTKCWVQLWTKPTVLCLLNIKTTNWW